MQVCKVCALANFSSVARRETDVGCMLTLVIMIAASPEKCTNVAIPCGALSLSVASLKKVQVTCASIISPTISLYWQAYL